MRSSVIFLFIYLVVAIANTLSWVISSDFLHAISKPLIMPVLMAYVIQVAIANKKFDTTDLLLLVSLLCYWGGDTVVMIDESLSFIGALGMLLIGMIMSIYLFFIASDKLKLKPVLALPYLIYGAAFYLLLLPKLGSFAGATTVFAIVMVALPFVAHSRKGHTSAESFQLVLLGSIALLVSNSIAGLDRFGVVTNMLTATGSIALYCAAHWLIVHGILIIPKKEDPDILKA